MAAPKPKQPKEKDRPTPVWKVVAVAFMMVVVAMLMAKLLIDWNIEIVERTEHRTPEKTALADLLADDQPENKKAPMFDPALVDRRKLDDWEVNSSDAMIRLDVPLTYPDSELALTTLHPSYRAALKASEQVFGRDVIPSVNLIDGKAKQFDDGLYAALDQAYYQGLDGRLLAHVKLVEEIGKKVGPKSPAAPFLAAGLELAGVKLPADDQAAKAKYLADFAQDASASKPIGFYTWNNTLESAFRFLRFFQREFPENDLAVPQAIAGGIQGDNELQRNYQSALAFYAKLSNPGVCRSVLDLIEPPVRKPERMTVALFPASDSREATLFNRLFPEGLPPGANLMQELIKRVRAGEVDLRPRPFSGWYDHQAYALETLLLPGRGDEADKLVLSASYKKRMMEAFQALIVKRRETHVRQSGIPTAKSEAGRHLPRPARISPRLRLEPCPAYLLRTARAYAFLDAFLTTSVGAEALDTLHGLKADGPRESSLAAELHSQRDLFYGLYLISCEDLGLKPRLEPDEPVNEAAVYQAASDWLKKCVNDPDLSADTRVSVPIFVDRPRNVTRLWATLGVRLAKLDASYVAGHAPRIRSSANAEWELAKTDELGVSPYLIVVDEFAEIELPGVRTLTREELRKICQRGGTKEEIVQALEGR